MKLKVSELEEGKLLNWAVAKCEGVSLGSFLSARQYSEHAYQYSTGWFQAGPIIEREKMSIAYNFDERIWEAGWDCHVKGWGDTPLIAAMRCYVANELGDEVEVPDELLEREV